MNISQVKLNKHNSYGALKAYDPSPLHLYIIIFFVQQKSRKRTDLITIIFRFARILFQVIKNSSSVRTDSKA